MMKTYLLDLDSLNPELFRSLIGFILSSGLNFRKIDLVTATRTGQSLVIEPANKSEEMALNQLLNELSIASPTIIESDGKANLDGIKLGLFCQVKTVDGLSSFYVDRTSGKKFAIQGGI